MLTACGGGGKDGTARKAVTSFNAGSGPTQLSEFVDARGAVASCRLVPDTVYKGQMLLNVITKRGFWLQSTIDPNDPGHSLATTQGGSLDPSEAAERRSRGDACKVSPGGKLSLGG